jgi:hypothetical protein
MATMEELEGMFDDHPSLDASLADFEPGSADLEPSPRFSLYPSAHSGFRSDDSDSEKAESLSGGGYSPPAWRRTKNGSRSSGFWNRNDDPLHSAGRLGMRSRRNSRESSPEYESADEGEDAILAAALRTRLPTGSLSPEKRRSPSPDPYPTGGGEFGRTFGEIKKEESHDEKATLSSPLAAPVPSSLTTPENPNNCML